MKSMFAWGAFTKVPAALLVAVAVTFSTIPSARAVEIAYEGFGYPTGYLAISDASTQELINDFGITDAGIYDGIDDGTAGFYDHDNDVNTPDIQDTVLGDPARAGGSGSWVADAGWIRRTVTGGGAHKVIGNETLSYSDSSGDSLVTTMGKPEFHQFPGQHSPAAWRAFDASTINDPAYPGGLTMPNTGSENTISAIDFEVPTLGKHDTEIWFSALMDSGPTSAANPSLQFWNKRDAVSLTETPRSRTAGIFLRPSSDGRFWQANYGEELTNHDLGTSADIPGTSAANSEGDVFIVVKFDYSATSPGGDTDGWAELTTWVNPDLNSEPDMADAALVSNGYVPFNAIYVDSADTGSSIDEIRIGTSYADVAPIAAGLDGDFDGDGDVDGNDFLVWQRGAATPADLALWQGNYGAPNSSAAAGAVPEPTSVLLLGIAGSLWCLRRRS